MRSRLAGGGTLKDETYGSCASPREHPLSEEKIKDILERNNIEPTDENIKEGATVLRRSSARFNMPEIDYSYAEVLLPLILTPVLIKPYDEHPVFQTIWAEARKELEKCRRLVIGGYSFPPTDFHVRRLLREAFCEHHLEELCVINPDTSVVPRAKDMCNYQGSVLVCSNLEEFIKKGI